MLQVLCLYVFSHFSWFYQRLHYSLIWKIFFLNRSLPSFLTPCFYQYNVLTMHLMTLYTFFKNNAWSNACFKFLMWIIYSLLPSKLTTSFSTFSILILSCNGKSLWNLCNFSGYLTSTSRKHPSLRSLLSLPLKSSLNWDVSSIHLNS